MAIGMYKLSYLQRKQLSSLFITLNVVQILLGFGMTSSSLYILIAVAPLLHTETAEINFAFTVTGIYGTHVIFHWIIGIKMCRKSLNQAHKKSTNGLLLLWYCAGTNTVIILIIISHFARKNGKHIIKSMKNSISNGMINYLKEASWKETIDSLQYSNECCGITSYEDWHEMEWLSKYHVDVKSQTVTQFRTSQEHLKLPVTPWSCCRIDFPMQCLHDPLQQAQYAHIWVDEPTIITDSINPKGCLEGIRKPITAVIDLFVFLTSLVFILHIIIFIISRILYTSSRNAILLNDIEGIAPGWIFGRGDCGYSRGKTLTEIMGITTIVIKENEKKTGERYLGNMTSKGLTRKKKKAAKNENEGILTHEESAFPSQQNQDETVFVSADSISFNPQWQSTNEEINDTALQNKNKKKIDDSKVTFSMEGEMERLMQE